MTSEVVFIGKEQGTFPRVERPWWKFHPKDETILGIAVWKVNNETARIIYTAGSDKTLGIPKDKGLSGGPETCSVYPEYLTTAMLPYI